MRILKIAFRFPPEAAAGVAQVIFPLAKVIVNNDHELIMVGRTPNDLLIDEITCGVRLIRIPISWDLKSAGIKLIEVASSFKPDIIAVHLLTGFDWHDILQCKNLCNAPLVHHLHVFSLICMRLYLFSDGKTCNKLCGPCQAESDKMLDYTSKVDGVISVSQNLLERHRHEGHFNHKPSQVIFPGIDKQVLKKKRNHQGQPIIGYLGRIDPHKGVAWLLHTCKEMDLQLKVAGDGPKELINDLKKRFASSKIEWLGWVDPADFLPKIDVLVVPSLFDEPFGLVCMEAFSHGLPVIASRVGGMASFIKEGINGWAINPNYPISLYKALTNFINCEPLDPLMVQETMWEYTPDKTWKRLEEFYKKILAIKLERCIGN